MRGAPPFLPLLLLFLLLSYCSGEVAVEGDSRTVVWDGMEYATLDGTHPATRNSIYGWQKDFLELPAGWALAKIRPGVLKHVIGGHSWGTESLVVGDGSGYCLGESTLWKLCVGCLESSGNRHRPAYSFRYWRRVLIQRPLVPNDGGVSSGSAAAAKRAAEEAAAKKATADAAEKAAYDAAAAKRAAEETLAKKAISDAVAKKTADDAIAKKAADEDAASKRAAEEAAAKKATANPAKKVAVSVVLCLFVTMLLAFKCQNAKKPGLKQAPAPVLAPVAAPAPAPLPAPAPINPGPGFQATFNRMIDSFEDGGMKAPISSCFKNITLASLEEALAPIRDKHPEVARQAKFKSKKLAKQYKMSEDEAGSLTAYSMELHPREESPYWCCNGVLREEARENIMPWVPFIYLVLRAMRGLPKAPEMVVYRGIRKSIAELGENFSVGADLVFAGFTSTATKMEVMQTFLGNSGPRTLLVLNLTEHGRSITKFSFFPGEHEVLLPPNATFEVVSHFDAGNGLTIVQCEQQSCIDQLLDINAA